MRPSSVINRSCRFLFGALVLFIAYAVYSMWAHGVVVQSSMSAMIPEQKDAQFVDQANQQVQSIAEQNVLLLLESTDQNSLQNAAEQLRKTISENGDLLEINNKQNAFEALVALIKPFRFGLLSADDKNILLPQNKNFLEEHALEGIYSLSSASQLLPIDQDPLNQFGHYIESKLTGSALINSEGAVVSEQILFSIKLLQAMSAPGVQGRVNEIVDELGNKLTTGFSDVQFYRSGVVFFAEQAAVDAKKDVNRISIGSGIGISLLLLLVFRSPGPLLVPVISIVVGVGFAFSVFHLAFNAVHVFTIVFGASLIGIVIDYSIHYFYHSTLSEHKPAQRSFLFRALLLSLLTSIMGYGALMFSSVLMLRSIALFSVCGIVAAWLSVMVLAPLFIKGPQQLRANAIQKLVQHLQAAIEPVFKLLGKTRALFLLISMLFVIGIGYQGQDDPRTFVHLSPALLEQSRTISTAAQQIEPGRYLLVQASSNDALLQKFKLVQNELQDHAQLESPAAWLPTVAEQAQNYQLQRIVYSLDGILSTVFNQIGLPSNVLNTLNNEFVAAQAQHLDLPTFNRLSGELMSPLSFESEGQHIAIALIKSGSDIDAVRSIAASKDGVRYVDNVDDSQAELGRQRISAMLMLLLAYVAVALLLWGVYRSMRSISLLLVPLAATIVTLFVLVLAGQAMTLFHTMALFLVLGLGMDYVIFLNEMKSTHTMQAIVLSALTSMVSFGLLAISGVPAAQSFGVTVFLGNALNLMFTIAMANSVTGVNNKSVYKEVSV